MNPVIAARTAHRGAILHFVNDPGDGSDASTYRYFEDGILLIANGHVEAIGPASELLHSLPPELSVVDHGKALLMPGFIDTHIHFPQTDVIASGGRELLEWLENYVFPEERKFADIAHARAVAEFFLDELLRNGTTTALVFGTVHAASVDAFFAAAQARQLRMIAGKVLMDRHCPDYLQDTAETGERDTRALIERWHGQDRLGYAITPRFAITSTEAQLASAGILAAEYPDTWIHSHVAENRGEIAWARELFPKARSYLDVYDGFGLLRERAIYAHCIHLDDADRRRMASTGATCAFCPTSNLFLGSGLFDLAASDAAGLRYGIATDVGGGSSFSLLETLGDAYKIAAVQGQRLHPLRAFYLATLAGARSLGLEDRIGSFRSGNEADFIVLDLAATPLLERRCSLATTISEKLLALMMLGDDRAVRATYIQGHRQHPGATP